MTAGPVTPVQARATALITEALGTSLDVGVAVRSPLGPRALRIQVAAGKGPSSRDVAAWAERQRWIDGVAERPRHVYARVGVDALRNWVTTTEPAMTGRSVTLSWSRATQSLTSFRIAMTADALEALLRWCGDEVRRADSGSGQLAVECDGGRSTVPVAGVDVRHGPLPARHGGTVGLTDLLTEIGRERLAFGFLRTARPRRVELDDDWLARVEKEYDFIVGACEVPDASAAPSDDAVRALALEVDALPVVLARAVGDLDPAIVLRYGRSLAERLQDADDAPLFDLARDVLRLIQRLLPKGR
jgi:hypothetical protein